MKKSLLFCVLLLSCILSFSQTTYTFVGNGLWSNSSNWLNNIQPPNTVTSGSTVTISPNTGDSCLLDIPVSLSPGANLIIATGAHFEIAGNLITDAYPAVTVCSQTWMSKNLAVTTYRNGDPIPQVTTDVMWGNPSGPGAWCYYNNDPSTEPVYGKLYNWRAVNDPRGLAPAGWHIPTDAEWTILTDCLGGETLAGPALKEAGFAHWMNVGPPVVPGTNSSGMTMLPAGWRSGGGPFGLQRDYGFWWSATSAGATIAWIRDLRANNTAVSRGTMGIYNGLSVRCVKD